MLNNYAKNPQINQQSVHCSQAAHSHGEVAEPAKPA